MTGSAISGRLWTEWFRFHNRLLDFRARLYGACNASTWDGVTYSPGYNHWRCMKVRGHKDHHRYNNYIWLGGGPSEYSPLPSTSGEWLEEARRELPMRKWTSRRHPVATRRRARIQANYHEMMRTGVRR